MTPAIIVHGGAGAVEDARRDRCIDGCRAAADAGWARLAAGAHALDAVEAAVRALEDDPEFNAGYGAVLTRAGTVEVDACIMTASGAVPAIGAVGGVPWLRHAVTLARRVLEDGEHVLLVGEGALAFAREHGIRAEPPEAMVSPRARARFERREGERQPRRTGDTVGACAVDAAGRVAAATSTGGISWKRPGRVGDTPLPGAGTWVDARAGAASATGHGESIIKALMTRVAVERLAAGDSPDQAARAAVAALVAVGGDGGVIVVGADGRVGHHTCTPRMPWASVVGGVRDAGAEPRP